MLIGINYLQGPAFEVVISGDRNSKDTIDMISEINKRVIPNMIIVFSPINELDSDIMEIAEYVKSQKSIDGKANAFVCRNFACGIPTTYIDKMLKNFDN